MASTSRQGSAVLVAGGRREIGGAIVLGCEDAGRGSEKYAAFPTYREGWAARGMVERRQQVRNGSRSKRGVPATVHLGRRPENYVGTAWKIMGARALYRCHGQHNGLGRIVTQSLGSR